MTVETSMTVAAFGHVINGTCESPAGRLSVLVDPVTDNVYARAAVGSADDVDRACRSSEKAARPGAGPPLRAVRSCCWPSRTRWKQTRNISLRSNAAVPASLSGRCETTRSRSVLTFCGTSLVLPALCRALPQWSTRRCYVLCQT